MLGDLILLVCALIVVAVLLAALACAVLPSADWRDWHSRERGAVAPTVALALLVTTVLALVPAATGVVSDARGRPPVPHPYPNPPPRVWTFVADPALGDFGGWLLMTNGAVRAVNDLYFGDLPQLHVNVRDVVALLPYFAPAAHGHGRAAGYWLIGSDGGVFAFGGAPFLGSIPSEGIRPDPASPTVGAAWCDDFRGYVLVLATGEVWRFGCPDTAARGRAARPG